MKSDVCKLTKDLACLENVLSEVEKTASFGNLETKSALRLRLLAEELCGMLPGLIENFEGEFWAEKNENEYSLCARLHSGDIDAQTKEELISLSSSGKNTAAKGIMGKIRDVVEDMLLNGAYTQGMAYEYGYSMGYVNMPAEMTAELGTIYTWTLNTYKTAAEEKEAHSAIEELERSIVANLADDILVGVRGKNVEIVVKKSF